MKKSKVVLVVALILMMVALPLLGACTKEVVKEVPVEKVVEKTVTKEVPVQKVGIGVSIPLTGAMAGFGMGMERALRIAEAEVNKGGIEAGGKRYELTIVIDDNAYVADKAVGVLNKFLFTDNLNIVATFGSVPAGAMAPILKGKDVLFWDQAAGFISPEYPNNFRTLNTGFEFAGPHVKWLKANHPEVKKVFYILPEGSGGDVIGGPYREAFKFYGIELVGEERHARTLTEYSPLIARAMATNPDMIVTTGAGPAGLLVSQLREKGFKGLIWFGSATDPDFVKLAGAAIKGNLGQDLVPESPLLPETIRSFISGYKAKYGTEPASYAIDFYNIPHILSSAIKKAGSVEIKKLVEAMGTQELDSPWGKFRFAGKEFYGIDRQAYLGVGVTEFQEGGSRKLLQWITPAEQAASVKEIYRK